MFPILFHPRRLGLIPLGATGACLVLIVIGLVRLITGAPGGSLWVVTLLWALLAVVAWRLWYRETGEQLAEILLWPLYRIRVHGPGVGRIPRRGPVVVLGNHAAWFDPIWIAKIFPRPLIPMMTSVFYDMPALHWLMVHVVRAIRVESSTYRREAPELQEAIAALDRGECVLIFPEGRMRRTEERPLRQFGQGVWHILQQRPATPVVVCWIEAGWGSYFSYWNGQPTKNKRMDWWRRIDIAMAEPRTLPKDLLSDHRTTRSYLMQECLQTRRYLGLEALTLSSAEEPDDEAAEGNGNHRDTETPRAMIAEEGKTREG